MKKLTLISATILLSLFVFFASPVHAQLDLECQRQKSLDPSYVCDDSQEPIKTNFFGLEISTEQLGIAKYVRDGITIAMGGLVIGAVFYGMYGIYVRSTAGDNEENLKKSISIFKNAVLAIIITIIAVVVVQVLSVILGLGNIWDVGLIGKQTVTNGVPFNDCDESLSSTCRSINEQSDGSRLICDWEFVNGKWENVAGSCVTR
jgi:hypothetical protein